jgi:ubiquinone biosynthesis protein COQ9
MSEAEPFSDLKSAEIALAQAVAGFVPELGLNRMSFQAGAKASGLSEGERDLIAPNGASDIAAILWRGHDAALTTPEVTAALPGMKIRERINYLLNLRIDAFAREEKLAHRLTGFLVLPTQLDLHRRLMWDTADLIWRLAGDKALDENHYSKRVIVCGILTTAMLTRLSRGAEAQSEQISRNIDAVMEYEKFKAKMAFKPETAFLQLATGLGKLRFGRSDAQSETSQ